MVGNPRGEDAVVEDVVVAVQWRATFAGSAPVAEEGEPGLDMASGRVLRRLEDGTERAVGAAFLGEQGSCSEQHGQMAVVATGVHGVGCAGGVLETGGDLEPEFTQDRGEAGAGLVLGGGGLRDLVPRLLRC